jgi:DNA-binding MarR family transcriptional regulator
MTSGGKRALVKLRALAGRLEDDLLAPLDDEERAQLHALMLRLAQRHLPPCAPS